MFSGKARALFFLMLVLPVAVLFGPENAHSQDLLILVPYKAESGVLVQQDSNWSEYAQDLADYKEGTGLSTHVLTLDRINRAYTGTDEPERVKRAIYDFVKNHATRFVILVGDEGVFPVRYKFGGYSSHGHTHWYIPEHSDTWEQFDSYGFSPCDAYYANLWDNADSSRAFDDWDHDQDGFYGEMYYDNFRGIDHNTIHPDVAVGRIPCRTPEEFYRYILKVIQYEYVSRAESSRALFIGGSFSNSVATKEEIGLSMPEDYTIGYLLWEAENNWRLDNEEGRFDHVNPRTETISFINGSAPPPKLLNYAGHANSGSWGGSELFAQ